MKREHRVHWSPRKSYGREISVLLDPSVKNSDVSTRVCFCIDHTLTHVLGIFALWVKFRETEQSLFSPTHIFISARFDGTSCLIKHFHFTFCYGGLATPRFTTGPWAYHTGCKTFQMHFRGKRWTGNAGLGPTHQIRENCDSLKVAYNLSYPMCILYVCNTAYRSLN